MLKANKINSRDLCFFWLNWNFVEWMFLMSSWNFLDFSLMRVSRGTFKRMYFLSWFSNHSYTPLCFELGTRNVDAVCGWMVRRVLVSMISTYQHPRFYLIKEDYPLNRWRCSSNVLVVASSIVNVDTSPSIFSIGCVIVFQVRHKKSWLRPWEQLYVESRPAQKLKLIRTTSHLRWYYT